MNFNPFIGSGVVNPLLMDVALRVQLAPSLYRLALEHRDAVYRHLHRGDSPLKSLVSRLYAQGSMAIGAVISSKFDNDEFDLDMMLELLIDANALPGRVLDVVYHTIKGEPGSRYYKVTRRNTRCVTVDYDNMHLDITPAVRLLDPRERVSNIFHAHEDDPAHKHRHVMANPYGFADWFEGRMPAARYFAETVLRKSLEPLPPLEQLADKSLPLLALQLIKRWRNKVYDQRVSMRMPPSVVLSCLVGMNAGVRLGLLEELSGQVNYIRAQFEAAERRGEKLHLMNPACTDGDCFTDRWPESLEHQRLFLRDLRAFSVSLAELAKPKSLPEYQRILGDLFGERAAEQVMRAFNERYEKRAHGGQLHHRPGSGAVALRESGLARSAPVAGAILTPRHTDFGSDE